MDIPKKLHFESNWFTALFAIWTKKMTNPIANQPSLMFKMNIKSTVTVYSDHNRSAKVLECKRSGRWAYNWDVLDSEGQDKSLGVIRWDVLGTMKRLGAESWKIYDPAGHEGGREILSFESESESGLKRIMDSMSDLLYNPGYAYVIKKPGGGDVARIFMKHGWWRQYYDFEILGGDKDDKKMALAVFAILILLMKK